MDGNDALATTRRSLHGIAECLLSGPQHRACRRLQLRVTPTGFATTGTPAVRVDGMELVVAESSRIPLTGTFGDVAAAAGLEFGEPADVYRDHSGVTADEPVALDKAALDLLVRWYVAGDAALRVFAPKLTPILWPEHFDVAVDLDGSTFGASPGDGFSATPYVYVSTANAAATPERNPFWNAPFGSFRAYGEVPPLDELVEFLREGQGLLA